MSAAAARPCVAAVVAAVVTGGVRAGLDRVSGGARVSSRWTRSNHRGEPVSLLEGPATAVGLLAGAMVGAATPRCAMGALVATTGGAVFGLVDDLAESSPDRGGVRTKGLRGHLGALAHGELTTGGLKVLGIGATALAAAALVIPTRGADGVRRGTAGWAADVAASGALIAATANLVNLLDLRPGRALKAAGLAAAPVAFAGGPGAGVAGAVLGAAAGALRADLAERDMLGDGGANALGALLGTALVLHAPAPARLVLLAGAVALTLASERVSFTEVIAATSGLRELDSWGRRPAGDPPA